MVAVLCSAAAWAAPKYPAAWTHRQAWPHPVGSATEFDLASRAETLAFVEALSAPPEDLGVKHPDLAATARWRVVKQGVLLENFRRAMGTCSAGLPLCPARAPEAWSELSTYAHAALEALPPAYAAWRTEARAFHLGYARELLRLAMLSGRTSSEIVPLAPGEVLGDTLPDRTFLLTFDDGPTGAAGETDRVVALMRQHAQHAVFFTVGAAMHARRSIAGLYDGQCLGSHGMEHESHVTSAATASALPTWNRELETLQPPGAHLRWFRPPYGQRTTAQVAQLAAEDIGVMLWNIDSQDWQAPRDASLVSGRVLTLMLLWRHGVVLFHDVHPAAREALPRVFEAVEGGAVTWADCRDL